MNHGFIKVAAAIPEVQVADCTFNVKKIHHIIEKANNMGIQILAFPELSVTGYTCGDLFGQSFLLKEAENALKELIESQKDNKMLCIIGIPVAHEDKIFNTAVAFQSGKILGLIPKTYLPNYKEFYEKRWFSSSLASKSTTIFFCGQEVPFGKDLLFTYKELNIGIEICEDLWMPVPPSSQLCMQGANLIINLSASNELIGKHDYLISLIKQQSARCITSYLYASAGFGESSTDIVFSGNGIIAENGNILAQSERFSLKEQIIYTEIDIDKLLHDRKLNGDFTLGTGDNNFCKKIPFELKTVELTPLNRKFSRQPFVPENDKCLYERCEEILNMQSFALAKRIQHTHADTVVVGISGGLDSTLALLVCIKTFDMLSIPHKRIVAVTMPGFGTTNRTYRNALNLMQQLGVTIREINIQKACIQHFKDIGHNVDIHDITYENSQARERTQILMDIANQTNGLVIGTGDLSELALGWATYNGDHMSMYGVNSSIPKTLVKYLVKWVALQEKDTKIKETLLDITETPISPELLPADKEDNIIQKTEDLVGPYELHDFFLYHFLRNGFTPSKIFFLAQEVFSKEFSDDTILKWMKTFFRRFFNQQFKRSCLTDGPKVGSVSLSPRGDWRMPSDASCTLWLKACERL
ncbi:NAD(+) synthase [Coprobacter tertius]|uniref:Glutamine-dependent NAD(+) synthetase n=1 Tax=Coprobacter tertius TaxID=2944915 RepID=A0ABT1MGQ1_9BACT|nr:NAD(+) synthase [Coprobacter tertius]MCP9611805.1 NAD(+) synthase [Coprobacter tertius]